MYIEARMDGMQGSKTEDLLKSPERLDTRGKPLPSTTNGQKSRSGSLRGSTTLTDETLINVLMNALNLIQERFGRIYFVRPEGDEPAMLVLPKSLDVCMECGVIFVRTGKRHCENVPALETAVSERI